MFEISEGDLPVVRTRQALLILDLQNDFSASGGVLPVDKPADYVEKISNLVPTYRSSGSIIWIKTQFETYRPVNDDTPDCDRVITDTELSSGSGSKCEPGRRRGLPSRTLLRLYDKMLPTEEDDEADLQDEADRPDEPYDNETFLTPELGQKPRCVLPFTLGANYVPAITEVIDLSRDIFLTKSQYSAFKGGALTQILRGQFVTELFICGSLTNISVFATAMDAAQFGYSITLLEDCLGYRSKPRHDEAIRQLIDTTGCEIMTSSGLIRSVKITESTQDGISNSNRPVRDTHDYRNLHTMITKLNLRNDTTTTPSVCESPAKETPTSKEASILTTQASTSHDSIQLAALGSDDSLADTSQIPKKAEGDTRKRVPNKIKTRRRPSKSHSKDTEGQKSSQTIESNPESGKTAPAPLSPTHATLISAAEVLDKLSMRESLNGGLQSPTESTEQAEHTAIVQPGRDPLAEVTENTTTESHENQDSKVGDSKASAVDPERLSNGRVPVPEPSADQDDVFPICDGDSEIIHNLLSQSKANEIFDEVRDEVRWQKMSHQGGDVPRLVSVQGDVGEDGSVPIYRHPADESPPLFPFTPAVSLIRSEVEKRLGHKVNHCLIQFYRNGTDYISEHSDKTLDIAPDSFIANVSLGALRAMTFRTKKSAKINRTVQDDEKIPRMSCKVPLPHNSMCKMSLRTNAKWLHGIRQDKRPVHEKSEAELAYDVGRISLTFRLIATFLDKSETKIWGQGAVAKEKGSARTVINGSTPQAEKMLWAFGKENHSSVFDWKEAYGEGFDVLHIQNQRKLFLSGDAVTDLRVKLMLSHFELDWTAGELSPFFYWKQGEPHTKGREILEQLPIKFVDNDLSRARTEGDLAVLLYLDASHGTSQDTRSQAQRARQYTRLQQADLIWQSWRAEPFSVKPFRRLLALWDMYASEDRFIAGPALSVADFAFWPILHEVVEEWKEGIDSPNLQAYYDRMLRQESLKKVMAELVGKS